MATTYSIEAGYNSMHDRDDVWNNIKQVFAEIQDNTKQIGDEVLRLEPNANPEMILDAAERYKRPVIDATVRIIDNEELQAIIQITSGIGPWRKAKESCRRAVCRLVLNEMH